MDILFCADDAYLMPLSVAIDSMMRNLSASSSPTVHILTTPVSQAKMVRFQNVLDSWGSAAKFNWKIIDGTEFRELPVWGHISSATYFRFLISEYLPDA